MPPIIKRAYTNEVEILSEGIGIPRAIKHEYVWISTRLEMFRNDILILYTDGITELKSEVNSQFGESQLLELIKIIENDPQIMKKSIINARRQHPENAVQSDELSLLIIQIKK